MNALVAMVGQEGIKERADFLAMCVKTGITLTDLAYMENVYSPPIGALNEPIAVELAGRVAGDVAADGRDPTVGHLLEGGAAARVGALRARPHLVPGAEFGEGRIHPQMPEGLELEGGVHEGDQETPKKKIVPEIHKPRKMFSAFWGP